MSASFCGLTLSVILLFNLSVAIPSMIISSYYVFATTDSDDEGDEQQEEEEDQQPQEPSEAPPQQPQQPQQPQLPLQPQPDQPSAIQQQQQPLPQQPQQPQQPLSGAQQQQSPLEDFILSGKINSLLPTGNNTWIADGNWNLVAENGSAKSFMTQMTWTSADGTKAHTHEFQNFVHADNGTNVAMSPGDTLILDGVMDVGTNDVIDWQSVPARLYFGNGQTIVVALDDAATNSHFGNQPVFGLVTSLTPCGSPGPSMEVLPRCE
jgi:hypothetical protein